MPSYGTVPRRGLKVARMMAHITYVSAESLDEKFGRDSRHDGVDAVMTPDFAVEDYLQHQGESFLDRFDALSYLYLSRLLDYFDPFADPDALTKLAAAPDPLAAVVVHQRLAVLDAALRSASTSIWSRPAATSPSRRSPVPYGHDSFLLEPPGYHERIAAFLA